MKVLNPKEKWKMLNIVINVFAAIVCGTLLLTVIYIGVDTYHTRQEIHATFAKIKSNNEKMIKQMNRNLQILRECNEIAREINGR